MPWAVLFETAFKLEFEALPEAVQDELLAHAKLLAAMGPLLQRPFADTLKGSKHANMKELRFAAGGGESPMPLTRSAERFFWLAATNRGSRRGASTGA